MTATALSLPKNKQTQDLSVAQSPLRRGMRRFFRDKRAWFGCSVLLTIIVAAIFAPWIAQHDPMQIDMRAFQAPPSSAHWLGTDSVGRDVFSRLLYGARVSLTVCLVAMTINVSVGTVLGALAGYFGGVTDQIISRISDGVLAFPLLVLVIVVVSILGPSLANLVVVIGLMGWPTICRLVRGGFLSAKAQEYVSAARLIGAHDRRIMWRHILPNIIAPIIVAATFNAASIILLEGSLSFLGLGVQPPQASWGNMLNDAQSIITLESMPWLWVPPGLAIALTVLSLNFVGDALRSALTPSD